MRSVAVVLFALLMTGCSALLGPTGWVAVNQVPLSNFLLLTATVATAESAYIQTKQILDSGPAKPNQPLEP